MGDFLLRGIVIGFLIAAPVGPIGVLCIRRGLARGIASGLATGLGAATADACYGTVAAFGVTGISSAIIGLRLPMQIIGILFLGYLGVRTLLERPAEYAAGDPDTTGLLRDFLSTFGLTLTNPATILSFAAVFAGMGAAAAGSYVAAIALVAGVFIGSALWWLLLSSSVGILRRWTGSRFLLWVNRVSGVILLLFTMGLLGSFLLTH